MSDFHICRTVQVADNHHRAAFLASWPDPQYSTMPSFWKVKYSSIIELAYVYKNANKKVHQSPPAFRISLLFLILHLFLTTGCYQQLKDSIMTCYPLYS